METYFATSMGDDEAARYVPSVLRYLDNLDTKSGALLTHVSMLVAAVTFLYAFEKVPLFQGILLLEAGLYVFIALGLLRTLLIVDEFGASVTTYEDGKRVFDRQALTREAVVRLFIYNRARILAIFATVALFASLTAKGLGILADASPGP